MDSLIPFTTSGSLVDCVDRKMLVVLRDGRKLHGVLRSYDQFANLVLEDTVERIYAGDTFAEKWCGLFLIRGRTLFFWAKSCLLSHDLDQEDDVPLRQVEYKQLDDYYRQDIAAKKQREEAKAKILYEQKGFCKEGGEGDGY
ncbi:Sm-like ribonucleoprotein [Lactarius quietus]|nr:Sm-like ribonucleoprotein [Lactarius quietus]